jgi:hypothetical protein
MNSYIQHVKEYASEHGISYREAMKEAKSSYIKKSSNISTTEPSTKPKPESKPKSMRPKSRGYIEPDSDKEEEAEDDDDKQLTKHKKKVETKAIEAIAKVKKTPNSKKKQEHNNPEPITKPPKKPVNFEIDLGDDAPSACDDYESVSKPKLRKPRKSKNYYSENDVNYGRLSNNEILELFSE